MRWEMQANRRRREGTGSGAAEEGDGQREGADAGVRMQQGDEQDTGEGGIRYGERLAWESKQKNRETETTDQHHRATSNKATTLAFNEHRRVEVMPRIHHTVHAGSATDVGRAPAKAGDMLS